jgi:hypothetical protein
MERRIQIVPDNRIHSVDVEAIDETRMTFGRMLNSRVAVISACVLMICTFLAVPTVALVHLFKDRRH